MKVYVTPLYKGGKPIEKNKKHDVFVGDLYLSDHLHPVLHRLVREATLLHRDGRHVIDPMIDVQVTNISADGFTLRGIECHGEIEQVQQWFVRPVFD